MRSKEITGPKSKGKHFYYFRSIIPAEYERGEAVKERMFKSRHI
jgi:hypothetical protein